MKASTATAAAGLGAVALAIAAMVLTAGSTTLAEERELPGMCNGRNDANLVVHARDGVSGYSLNVNTSSGGSPHGSLSLGRGKNRLHVTDWCRAWQHQPGQPYGDQCSADIPEGAVTAHAVGIAFHAGEEVLVRTDVRQTDEGRFFRLRYRAINGSHTAEHDDGGCDDESWTKVPEHGWSPLDRMKVHTSGPVAVR